MPQIRDAILTIVKFLSLADKAGFMFSQSTGTSREHLSELITGNNGNAWEYFSPELIPFHEWVGRSVRLLRAKRPRNDESEQKHYLYFHIQYVF
ncbi:MAG: hypothetical protein AABZ32_00625 [Bacteroidota bacterium]